MKRFVITLFCALLWQAHADTKLPVELKLDTLRASDRLYINAVNVQLVPEDADLVYAKSAGVFRLLQESGSELRKGEIWGVLNLDNLQIEQRSLEAETRALPERVAKLKLANEEVIAKSRLALNEAKTELANFEALLAVEELESDEESQLNFAIALEELKATVKRAQSKLALDIDGLSHETELQRLEISHEKQEATLKDLIYESEYRAPFDGILDLAGDLSLDPTENKPLPRDVRIVPGDVMAVIQNDSAFQIVVEPFNVDFEGVSRSGLFMIIDAEKNEGAIRANFSNAITDPKNPSAVQKWVFKVAKEDVDDVKKRGVGSPAFASVFFTLEEEAKIVSKSILLAKLPDGSAEPNSWRAVLAQLLPECKLVAEGRGALAVSRR